MAWLMRPEGFAIVDTQMADGARARLKSFRDRADRELDLLINTHHHGDHVGGNVAFVPAAEASIAHRDSVRQQLRVGAEGATQQVLPLETFLDEWETELGGETIRLKHYGAGHTAGDAVVFFEKANVVHVGDLVFHHLPPFIDFPGGCDLDGWEQALVDLKNDCDSDTIVIFGHGNPAFGVTGTRDDLLYMRDFLQAGRAHVTAKLDAGTEVDALLGEPIPGYESHLVDGFFRQVHERMIRSYAERG
jgi:glyoxylase-like metal-dependent hydrolase (beta-lactamase superfamily II)